MDTMTQVLSRFLTWIGLPYLALPAAVLVDAASIRAAEPEAQPSPEAVRFFESRVRPVLADNCFKCHSDKKQRGGLRVDSRAALIKGGDQGAAIAPGKPEESLLLRAVRHEAELKMPPTKKLDNEQIADLTKWVRMGAPWPTSDAPGSAPRTGRADQRALEQKRAELQGALAGFETEFSKLYEQSYGKAIERRELPRLIRSEGAKLLGKERFQRYTEQRDELRSLLRNKVIGEAALCVTESGNRAPDTFVLLRGNPHVKGERVEPAFPVVLGGDKPVIPAPPSGAKTSGRRRVLADWIASAKNPLTARVAVNRLWQYHFGRGIVRSSSNFGVQGDKPTHPELLDWLADEFIRRGWSLKQLHRLILTSNAYRMSSRGNDKALALDPTNDLFWRFDMRRLTAEEIRDSILALSGTLNRKMNGPGVYTAMPREVLAGQSMPGNGWGTSSYEEQCRRSIYVHLKRSLLTPILESFDAAETDRSTAIRFVTTQPTQALALLNSDFLHKQAALFADRLRREAGEDTDKQIRLALSLATARSPSDTEVRRGVDLIAALRSKDDIGEEAALRCFCLMVLNINEFVYLD
jgi:mono/diheme cytochrome c family protein